MKLKELYSRAIQAGIDHDPRGRENVMRVLESRRKTFEDLREKDKNLFDVESLENPYADSRILFGSGDEDVSSILVGVDIGVGEVLLAESLSRRGHEINLLLSHHPEGMAFATLYSVMNMQSAILNRFGVPINIAEDLMEGRSKEVERKLMPANHLRAVDAARLLGIPFICLHTPADNMVQNYLQTLFDEKKPGTLEDIVDMLHDIPEYNRAARQGTGPKIILGSNSRTAGKVFVDMTGGTEGAKEVFASLTASGVNTIVAMHLSEEHRKEAELHHLNVVIAGHISSDNLGVNLLLDKVLAGTSTRCSECSGFFRTGRTS